MALSEIEKLERRYAENPQGLTFAPLAEVHRKNGDVARALELLRPGLTLHPDYIPASIVLGRCHLDLGDLEGAEAAFGHVLGLDGENVIALKALADITERLLRFEESERWLRALLEVDRSNDEAREQLARVELARQQAASPTGAPPLPPAVGEPAVAVEPTAAVEGTPAEGGGAQPSEAGAPAHPEPAISPPPPPPAFGWLSPVRSDEEAVVPLELEELEAETIDVQVEVHAPEGIELEQPIVLDEPVAPISGLVGRDEEPPETEVPTVEGEFAVETAQDIVLESAGGSEFQVANASEELLRAGSPPAAPMPHAAPAEPPAGETAAEPEPVHEGAGATAPAPPPAPEPAVPGAPGWASPIADPGRPVAPALMLTESMAELLLQQGHTHEALRLFRELEIRNGSDARLRERVAAVERSLRPEAPTPPSPPPDAEPAPAGEPAASSARATRGQSVGDFLRTMLAARPPAWASGAGPQREPAQAGHAAPQSEGAPTRPAQDSLSLSSVFGDDATPTPPAVPASGTGSGAPAGAGGVSYDEFFGSTGGGAPHVPRPPDAKNDDLDQFHAWLQKLKR